MKLYFGNAITAATTLMLIGLLGLIIYSFVKRNTIQFWGRRCFIVFALGLTVCCFAAARDGLDKTIQYTIDGSCAPGIFSFISIPTIVGCIGAAVIIISVFAAFIAKTRQAREIWFFVMSSGIILKILVMEISRCMLK